MKKLWSFILSFAFAVTLCACSSTQSENTNSSPALPEDPESAQLSENSQTEDDTDPEQLLQRLRCTFVFEKKKRSIPGRLCGFCQKDVAEVSSGNSGIWNERADAYAGIEPLFFQT
jgi:hypothetical protein